MRNFKHKLTGKILVIGGQTGESMLRYITGKNDGITLSEIITNSNEWEEITEYPIGTKVLNSGTNTIYTKKEDGWYNPATRTAYTDKIIRDTKSISVIDEKVVEKDYEILSIYNPKTKEIITDSNVETWENITSSRGQWVIHSIKRLSDGEIFTVGDKCITIMCNYGKIKLFEICNNKLYIKNNKELSLSYTCDINDLLSIKQPSFTTEDGVDIYEDKDGKITYWTLYTGEHSRFENHWKINPVPNICKNINPTSNDELSKYGFKRFSTKETAEEYIIRKKPCLSLEEIIKTFKLSEKSQWSGLEKLVKSKL